MGYICVKSSHNGLTFRKAYISPLTVSIAAAVPDFPSFVCLQNINIILFTENPFYSVNNKA